MMKIVLDYYHQTNRYNISSIYTLGGSEERELLVGSGIQGQYEHTFPVIWDNEEEKVFFMILQLCYGGYVANVQQGDFIFQQGTRSAVNVGLDFYASCTNSVLYVNSGRPDNLKYRISIRNPIAGTVSLAKTDPAGAKLESTLTIEYVGPPP